MAKKTEIKHLVATLIFSVVVAFLLFIYEPIIMYAGNINEFWFDIETLRVIMLLPFFVTAIALGIFYVLFFFATRRKPKIFYFLEIISFSIFIYLYIHGNFLTSMLPTLYGDIINWWGKDFIVGHIISAVLLIAIIVAAIFSIKRFSVGKTARYSFYTIIIFSIMMFTSFVTTLTTPDLFIDKTTQPIATIKNLNKISSKKNFYILLVDCTDSKEFNDFVTEKYEDDFKDFTYFKDAASGYSSTRDSIPLIFSGQFYKNEIGFNEFSTKALDNSKTFAKLESDGYDMNFYNNDFVWNSRKSMVFSNLSSDISNYNKKGFIKQEIKYTLYKYLPFAFKSFSKIESMDFSSVIINKDIGDIYEWENMYYYDNVLSKKPEMVDEKLFQYVHLEGSHSPYDMDENLNEIPGGAGTYIQKIGASAKIASLAIERYKESGAYNDSVIVIMADHGWYEHVPVLYIKGVGEEHSKMKISDKQVSWADLDEAFTELVNGETSEQIFSNVPTDGRVRYFYADYYYDKGPILESINRGGKSYDSTAWELTGVEYPYPD
ncbi:hypothetical protein IKG29_03490 [Candidatus Saccharibacteria bacterium]|nr:hypothetical protein [Candidatus Saccharibacteria bacterium]